MPDLVEIARIKGPHGLKGRLRVIALSGSFENFHRYTHFFIGHTETPLRMLSLEQRKGFAVMTLEGIETISQVERIRGELLYISRDQLEDLEEGEVYWRDMLGLMVFDSRGNELGKVMRVFSTGSNDVLEVNSEKGYLVPVTKDVVLEISIEHGRIVIDETLMEGLLD